MKWRKALNWRKISKWRRTRNRDKEGKTDIGFGTIEKASEWYRILVADPVNDFLPRLAWLVENPELAVVDIEAFHCAGTVVAP